MGHPNGKLRYLIDIHVYYLIMSELWQFLYYLKFSVHPDGRVCISILHIHLVKIPMVMSLQANGGHQCIRCRFLFRAHKCLSLFVCLQNNIYYLTLIQLFLHTMECLCVGLFLYESMSLFDSACLCLSHIYTLEKILYDWTFCWCMP
jgi:hypothetical protein